MLNHRSVAWLCILSGLITTAVFAAPTPLQQIQLPAAPVKQNIQTVGQVLTAELVTRSRSSGRFTQGGHQWNCQARLCRSGPVWPAKPLAVCRALARKVGQVKRFYFSSQALNPRQIEQCNAATAANTPGLKKNIKLSTPSTSAPAGIMAGSEPVARPGRLQPATAADGRQLPSAAQAVGESSRTLMPGLAEGGRPVAALPVPSGSSPASPSGGFRDDRPSNRDAVNAVREAMAARASRASIRRVIPAERGYVCVSDSGDSRAEFVIHGSRFGASAAGRRVVLATLIRKTVVATATIVSWSDSRIVARLPYHHASIRDGQSYLVGLQNSSNRWVSNISREIRICPDYVQLSGRIELQHCAAGLRNVRLGVSVDGRRLPDVRVEAVPGNDFVMQYSTRLRAQPLMNVQLTPKLVDISCPGGEWTPVNKSFRLGFQRSVARQDFAYRVELQRFSIPMTAVAGLVQNAFRGTSMRINNYDAASRSRRSNDTRLSLSDALGGTDRIYDIAPVTQGPRSYYINDINLNNIQVRATRSGLKVTLGFENAGVEFKGHCRPGNPGERINCALGAPDVDATLSVDIFLTLDRYYSRSAPLSISFTDIRVEAHPNARARGFCGAIDICNLFTNYKQRIREAVEVNLQAALDTGAVRDNVANALRPTLRGFNIGRVNSARVEGSQFVIMYLPAE